MTPIFLRPQSPRLFSARYLPFRPRLARARRSRRRVPSATGGAEPTNICRVNFTMTRTFAPRRGMRTIRQYRASVRFTAWNLPLLCFYYQPTNEMNHFLQIVYLQNPTGFFWTAAIAIHLPLLHAFSHVQNNSKSPHPWQILAV